MHTVHQQALDRQTITKANDSEETTQQQAVGVKTVFTQEKISKALTNPNIMLFFEAAETFYSQVAESSSL